MDAKLIEEMKDWISECVWADLDDEIYIRELPDHEVVRGIERHYDGGVVQFIRACE